jgi:predicted metal-dependent HD superfamily phosphohydrolase
MIEWIQEQWMQLGRLYCNNEETLNGYFNSFEEKYSTPGRYYHTIDHITSLLKMSEKYSSRLKNKEVVDLSIFYHDIIYNVLFNNNEDKSAAYAGKQLTALNVPAETVQAVVAFIKATKTHELKEIPLKKDLAYFLDFDISILAAEPAVYHDYITHVRKEYEIYPDDLYKKARNRFLAHCMAKKHIFYTLEFRTEYEEKARQNILNELRTQS